MKREFSPLSFTGGIVLGVLLATAWYLGGLTPAPVSPTADTANASTTAEHADSSGTVSVSDQSAGSSVSIASLTVPPPGVWVAVREVSAGALGNVLGAVRAGGPRMDFSVPLLRATEPGQTYAVELYRNNGDGVFDLSTDSVYVDFDTGSRVVAYFTTTD
jgi:hypothetical protein